MNRFLSFLFALMLFSSSVFAAQYDIKEMTPAIQQALQNRQARYEQLQTLKAQGILGENNQGFVTALKPEGGTAAASENQDRQVIYQAIVQQNNLPASGIAQVEAAFASVQREKARPGDSIQTASGQWVQK